VDSFTPTSASVGQKLTINGKNLADTSKVGFGGVEANPSTKEDTKVSVIVPSGAKSGSITLTTPGGTQSKDGFKIVTPPKKTPATEKKPAANKGRAPA
jgi:IPT/TIG domain